MTTDQSKLARSRLLVADAFQRARIDTKPDPHDLATWLLEQLQTLGWKSPPDPAVDIPPLRPDRPADEDSPGRRAFREARNALATKPRRADTASTTDGRDGH